MTLSCDLTFRNNVCKDAWNALLYIRTGLGSSPYMYAKNLITIYYIEHQINQPVSCHSSNKLFSSYEQVESKKKYILLRVFNTFTWTSVILKTWTNCRLCLCMPSVKHFSCGVVKNRKHMNGIMKSYLANFVKFSHHAASRHGTFRKS